MAKEAARPEDRDRYRHEQNLWLQIADEIERRDEATAGCELPFSTGP